MMRKKKKELKKQQQKDKGDCKTLPQPLALLISLKRSCKRMGAFLCLLLLFLVPSDLLPAPSSSHHKTLFHQTAI